MNKGSCNCGSLTYEIAGKITDCSYCHCSICRKLTGSALAAYGTVRKSDFSWISGENNILIYRPTTDTIRMFCTCCGSFILSEHIDEPENVFVSLGSLDSWERFEMEYHQFYKSKVGWCKLKDNLKKYDRWPE